MVEGEAESPVAERLMKGHSKWSGVLRSVTVLCESEAGDLMSTLDHIGINVTDYDRSKTFYAKALAPLGITLVMEYGKAAGFGRDQKPDLWIGQGATRFQKAEQLDPITPVHVCVVARSRAEVDAFHAAAMAAGGRDNGPPGLRPEYHPGYYGAFVLDPDGHNLEAVIHTA